MIHGEMWQMHDDATIKKIEDAAFSLLTQGGARIMNKELLDMLEAAGCRIVRSEMRCFFTEKLVRKAVAHFGRKGQTTIAHPEGWDPRWNVWHGGSHPHYLDWPSGERRMATKQDVTDMAKMAHTLEEFQGVGKVFTCNDVDQRIEPLWSVLQIAKITDKPMGSGEVFFGNYLDDLVAMSEVITGRKGDTSLIPSCDFFIQPLIMETNQADCFLKKRRFGMSCDTGTMAVSGMSGPVTIAGTVALSLAELLAGWTMGYLVNPDTGAAGVVATGSLDMRTMTARFGSPEAILQNTATTNIAKRLYGISPWCIISYVDCKRPGLEAAYQKMFALATTPFTGQKGIGTDGLLSAGQDYSPVQQILDAEMHKVIDRFWGHFAVNDETLAVDLPKQMMQGTNTNFLTTDHTMMNWQGEQWYPKWFDLSVWKDTKYETGAEADLLKRIDQYCKDAVKRYEAPAIDQTKIRELEKIYAAAEKRLLV